MQGMDLDEAVLEVSELLVACSEGVAGQPLIPVVAVERRRLLLGARLLLH